MTETEVAQLIARSDKLVTRSFQWSTEEGSTKGERFSFESSVQVGGEMPYALRFIVKYRAPKKIYKGRSTIAVPEKFDAGLVCTPHRIAALDTNPGVPHTNSVGMGRPYYGKTLWCDTHRHIWVGSYGYAEPVEPSIMDVVDLVYTFVRDHNLVLHGDVKHPLLYQTGDFFK